MAIISIPTSVSGVSIPGPLGQFAKGPLSSLFGGKGVNTYKYPSDLASDATKNHYVQFLIKEVVPAGYTTKSPTTTGYSLGTGLGSVIASGGAKAATLIEQAGQLANGEIAQKLGITQAATNAANAIRQKTGVLSDVVPEQLTISPRLTQPKAYISLYMPDTLNASYDASYDKLELANDLGSLIPTLRSIGQISGKIGNDFDSNDVMGSLSKLGKSIGNLAATDPNVLNLIRQNLKDFAGIDTKNLIDLLQKGRGFAINPQMQMIFRGIDFRSFQLTFTFTPKSKEEADNVDNIIHTFKYHWAPSLQAGKQTSNDSMFLIPPSIFNLQFKLGQKENKYIPKYGDCILENVTVDYAPNGWSSHDDGAPVQTALVLQFREIEILDRDRLQKGHLQQTGGLR